jgi:hypothetical protein
MVRADVHKAHAHLSAPINARPELRLCRRCEPSMTCGHAPRARLRAAGGSVAPFHDERWTSSSSVSAARIGTTTPLLPSFLSDAHRIALFSDASGSLMVVPSATQHQSATG